MKEHPRERPWERRSPERHPMPKECESGDSRSRGDSRPPERRGWFSRGYVPHYDADCLVQHVTIHLSDSLPKSAIDQIEQSLKEMPEKQRDAERRKRLHDWIDAGHGSCLLQYPEIAEMVQNAFLHFDGIRYNLNTWIIMPNHAHILFEPIDDWSLNKIVASWKKFTGRKIRDWLRERANREICDPGSGNAVLPNGILCPKSANQEIRGPSGPGNPWARILKDLKPVWHPEFWDRYIRNERHYAHVIDYIHNNPVAVGLVENPEAWPWSNASTTTL